MEYIYILLSAVLWGSLGIPVTKLKELGLTVYEVGALRSLGGALILGIILILRKQSFRVNLKWIPLLIGVGITSQAGLNLGYFTAINYVGLGTAVILLYTSPIFANIFSYIVYREPFTLKKIFAVIFSIIGCFLATTGGSFAISLSILGILAGLLSGLSFGLNPIVSKKLQGKVEILQILFYGFLFGGIIQLLFTNVADTYHKFNLTITGYAVVLAIIPTIIPFFLYNKGLKNVSPGLVSILCSMEVVVATLVSRYYFTEYLNSFKVFGIFLIIAASIIPSINFSAFLKNKKLAKT